MIRVVLFVLACFILLGQPQTTPPGNLTVIVDGKIVGTTSTTLKFISGSGVLMTGITLPSGEIDITTTVDSSLVLTKDISESGICSSLVGTSKTSAYTAALTRCRAVTGYNAGMTFLFTPDAPNINGACTLSIDNNLPAPSIKLANGNDPAANQLLVGSSYWVRFDGTFWRLI